MLVPTDLTTSDAPARRISAQRACAVRDHRRRYGAGVRGVWHNAGPARPGEPRRTYSDPAGRRGAVALCAHALAEGGRAMTRGHRTFHRLLWPALAVIVALGF